MGFQSAVEVVLRPLTPVPYVKTEPNSTSELACLIRPGTAFKVESSCETAKLCLLSAAAERRFRISRDPCQMAITW